MSYKFQSGDATLSGSVTLVNYQDLLFEADGTSDIGSAAKEVGVLYTTRATASVGISGSAIYANKFYGNGSGLTGISSDSVDVVDSSANSEFGLVGVAASGDGVTLTTMDTAADRITMNAQSGKLTLAGALQVGALTSGRLPLVSTSGLINDNAVITYGVGRELEGYNYIALSSSVSGSAYMGDGLVYVADNSAGGGKDVFVANAQGVDIGDDGFGDAKPAIAISLGSTGSAGSLVKAQINVMGINRAGTAGPKGAGMIRLSGSGANFSPATFGGQTGVLYGAIAMGAQNDTSGDIGTEAGIACVKIPAAWGGTRQMIIDHKEGQIYISGSKPTAGVKFGSDLLSAKDAYFNGDMYLGNAGGDTIKVNGTIAGNGNQVLVSASMTALNVNSKNSGGNSFVGIGGALFGHSGGGNADVKIGAGNAGNVSGSNDFSVAANLQAAKNKFIVDTSANVNTVGSVISSGGNINATNGNISGSGNILGQRVSVDGNVVAGNNLSASAKGLFTQDLQAAKNKFTVDTSANVMFKGGLTAAGLGSATVDLTTDLMIIDDGAGGTIKTTSLADYATALAGGSNEGLKSTAGRLALDLNDLAAGTVNVAADSFAMKDADDDSTKIFTMASYATAIAGAGITATNGVLSTDAQSVNAIGNANALLAEGTNYLSASLNADRTYRTPVNPTVGDIIRIKAGSAAQMDTHKMILSASGLHQIDGERLINIQSAYAGVSMVYVSTGQWRIF